MIPFLLPKIDVFCTAEVLICNIAVILLWRLVYFLLALAVNKVNFHRLSGKEVEFSWRGR